MKERIVIVFIAVVAGLLITTVGFFIYQTTKTLPKENPKKTQTSNRALPPKKNNIFLTIDEPKDEILVDKRTIQIKGKTNPENVIVASTNQEDSIATPTSFGQFSLTIAIDAGTNKLITRALSPSGEEKIDERVVTFSTEEF